MRNIARFAVLRGARSLSRQSTWGGAHAGLTAASALTLLANVVFAIAGPSRALDVLGHSLMLLAYFVIFGGIILRMVLEQEQAAHAELRTTRDERDRLMANLMSSQEEERAVLAHALLEDVGQPLARMAALLNSEGSGGCAGNANAELRALAAGTVSSVRKLSQWLRPSTLSDVGLAAAVRSYAEAFDGMYGLTGRVVVIGSDLTRLPPAVETALYRAVIEALTNVAKHSGGNRYDIVVDLRGPGISVVVEDNGHGFDVASTPRGFGFLSMAERMAQIGGTLSVESGADTGTTICLRVAGGSDQSAP